MREQILDHVLAYGTGADTLRCLALATVDSPMSVEKMNLQDPATFADYEVSCVINHLHNFEFYVAYLLRKR